MAYQVQRSARAELVARSVEELNQRGASFIRNFERQEPGLVGFALEIEIIAAAIKAIIAAAEDAAKVGTVTFFTGLGVAGLGLIAAPFTGGGSAVAAAGAVAAMVGGGVAITAKVTQFLLESGKARVLEKLGNEFMKIARPLNEELKEVKTAAKDLQVDVVDYLLSEKVRRIEEVLRKVDDASGAIEDAMAFMRNLVQLVLKLLQRITTSQEEEELTKKVVESGEQCWKIIKHFREAKKDLEDFKENMAIC